MITKSKLVQAGRLILSLLFVFSAISKLISLPFFDGMVAELFIGKDYFDHPRAMWFSQFFTRLVISGELLLGAAILQQQHFKKIVLPTIQLMLLAFTLHLIYEGTRRGFIDGNCGCFGDVLPMTNLESIIKNVVAMLIGLFLWKFYRDEDEMRFKSWVMPFTVGAVCMATLLLTIKDYSPEPVEELEEVETIPEIEINEIQESDSTQSIDTISETIEAAPIVEEIVVKKEPEKKISTPSSTEVTKKILMQYAKFEDGSKMNLETEDNLVCIFSLTCSHCQQAYKEICAISKDGELPNVYLLTYGTEYDLKYFFNQAGDCKHPHMRTMEYDNFKRMLEGEDFPRIMSFKNGEIDKTWNTDTYSEQSLRDYYSIPKKPKKRDPIKEGIDISNDNVISPFGGDDNPWD